MVFDILTLRLYHNKTLHEGRYNHRKIISQYIYIYCWVYIYKHSPAALGTNMRVSIGAGIREIFEV